MDLRQYLIAPHERPPQQPARHNTPVLHHQQQPTTNTLDPRLAHRAPTAPTALLRPEHSASPTIHPQTHMGDYEGRIRQLQQERLQLQQQPRQQSRNQAITREQVISGLTAYPDILAAILRSGQFPDQTESDTRASAQHPDTSSLAFQPTIMTLVDRTTISPYQQTSIHPVPHSTVPSSPIPPTNSVPLPGPTAAKIPKLCFWHYHFGSCTNDPASSSYNPLVRACPYLHDVQGMQQVEVQQGRENWHRGLGDCGLELCRFSNNYRFKDGLELEDEKRRWTTERKKERKKVARAEVMHGVHGDDSVGVTEPGADDLDAVKTASQSILVGYGEQDDQDETPIASGPIAPAIPTSPRAGRYAKGTRRPQASASSPAPTNKRKAYVLSQSTPTPVSKKSKTSTQVPSDQTTDPAISITPDGNTPLSKKAAKRLKRLNKKSQATIAGTITTSPPTLISSTPASPTPKACEIIPSSLPSVLSSSSPSSLSQPTSSRPNIKVVSKPHHRTCFLWYHDRCPKKGRNCKELHALTQPPSFVVAPRGFVHEGGVCGLEWCGGDWRGVEEEIGDGGAEEDGQEEREAEEDETVEETDDGEMQADDANQDIDDEEGFEVEESADEMVD